LERAVEAHRGRIMQVPPMYSALKQGGERLYRKARRGEVVDRDPRPVDISRLDITAFEAPDFSLLVECSKGTYVRTLVEDVARAAGSCGHVTSLRRLGAGPFAADGMHTLAAIEAGAEAGPDSMADFLLPADSALAGLPQARVDAEDALRLGQGQTVAASAADVAPGLVRLYGPGGFLGVGELTADGRLAPRRLMGPESGA
jgi:tRNA pseudouridine55 synthase